MVLVTSSFNLKIKCFPKFISSKFTEKYEISEKFHELIIKIIFSCPAELSPLNSLFSLCFNIGSFPFGGMRNILVNPNITIFFRQIISSEAIQL